MEFFVNAMYTTCIGTEIQSLTLSPNHNQGGAADRSISNLEQEHPEQPRGLKMSSLPKSVLIVDDNLVDRKLMRLILEAENYTTVEAGDGIEALAALKFLPFDIVVCDVLMPNMDGLPSLRFVKTQFEQVLRNLLGNAIKYRSAVGQKIHVRAERQPGAWIFSVTDNGIGFEQEYAEKVFLMRGPWVWANGFCPGGTG
jgi:CheY-like chemotaxis protein